MFDKYRCITCGRIIWPGQRSKMTGQTGNMVMLGHNHQQCLDIWNEGYDRGHSNGQGEERARWTQTNVLN